MHGEDRVVDYVVDYVFDYVGDLRPVSAGGSGSVDAIKRALGEGLPYNAVEGSTAYLDWLATV